MAIQTFKEFCKEADLIVEEEYDINDIIDRLKMFAKDHKRVVLANGADVISVKSKKDAAGRPVVVIE